ncbi:hypothetical protein ATCM_11525 [Stenotrophomonas sp. ATCM1_4]|nr:hypothetical protein ATCM_11525 [Stenotrophomonas sp. ATCM1_4]
MGILLTACVVGGWNADTSNGYKVIQAYQKEGAIGHTDANQRRKDALDCGVLNYNEGSLDGSVQYPGMTIQQVMERRVRIDNCMKSKGYIIDDPVNCTSKGRPTGFCN